MKRERGAIPLRSRRCKRVDSSPIRHWRLLSGKAGTIPGVTLDTRKPEDLLKAQTTSRVDTAQVMRFALFQLDYVQIPVSLS